MTAYYSDTKPHEHGGNLELASQRWGIPEKQWLDLSTAISPFCYPLSAPPADIWQRLPYDKRPLIRAAKSYYHCDHLLAVAGSQQAIEILPRLFEHSQVALPRTGYSEHTYHWQHSAHTVAHYKNGIELQNWVNNHKVNIAVIINPNNPTGEFFTREFLLGIATKLHNNAGFLILDEAFIDVHPHRSLSNHLPDNTIILRSVGKFFGLAGIRMGFVLARSKLLDALQAHIGLWPISGPSLWAAQNALADEQWQTEQRVRLKQISSDLEQQLRKLFPSMPITRQDLFVSIVQPAHVARNTFEFCAKKGILLRHFELSESSGLLRIGLPANRDDTHRLLDTLSLCTTRNS